MTSDKLKGAHGGKREGSGRPQTGRKRQQYYVTDEENEQIKEFIERLRIKQLIRADLKEGNDK